MPAVWGVIMVPVFLLGWWSGVSFYAVVLVAAILAGAMALADN